MQKKVRKMTSAPHWPPSLPLSAPPSLLPWLPHCPCHCSRHHCLSHCQGCSGLCRHHHHFHWYCNHFLAGIATTYWLIVVCPCAASVSAPIACPRHCRCWLSTQLSLSTRPQTAAPCSFRHNCCLCFNRCSPWVIFWTSLLPPFGWLLSTLVLPLLLSLLPAPTIARLPASSLLSQQEPQAACPWQWQGAGLTTPLQEWWWWQKRLPPPCGRGARSTTPPPSSSSLMLKI